MPGSIAGGTVEGFGIQVLDRASVVPGVELDNLSCLWMMKWREAGFSSS